MVNDGVIVNGDPIYRDIAILVLAMVGIILRQFLDAAVGKERSS